MVIFSDLFCNKSLGGSARRYLAPFWRHFRTLLRSVFFSTTSDGVTSFFSRQQCLFVLRFYGPVNPMGSCRVRSVYLTTRKRQRYIQNCWRDFFIWWRKVGRIGRIQLLFRRFLCVRIEIDQLLCVICWVINQGLSGSCKKINHSIS